MKIRDDNERNFWKHTERLSPVKKITVSGIVMALYISGMFYTQIFAFGQFQIRIATPYTH